MKILHVVSNWKWTGPAEPAVNLAAELSRRGHDVKLLVGRARGDEAPLRREAMRRGIEPDESLVLGKHRNPLRDLPDRRRLERLLRAERFDVAHAHLGNDHRLLAAARGAAHVDLPIVRTYYGGDLPESRSERRLLARDAEAITTPSDRIACLLPAVLGVPRERVERIETAIDLDRFSPRGRGPDLRERLGVPSGAVVIGVVARMQRHRRFEVLLDAFARAAREEGSLRFLLVGRGTWRRTVAEEPVKRLGIADRTIFPGYLAGDDYPAALRAMDARAARCGRRSRRGFPPWSPARGCFPRSSSTGAKGSTST
jgi:glycosyltransferase involved in cell wall biosynthesis